MTFLSEGRNSEQEWEENNVKCTVLASPQSIQLYYNPWMQERNVNSKADTVLGPEIIKLVQQDD